MISKNTSLKKILFPIIYNSNQITEEQFLIAIEKLMQKFNITKTKAYELAEDIIKLIITQNKPPSDLAHNIEDLGSDEWEFLREKSIAEVINEYENSRTKSHHKFFSCILKFLGAKKFQDT